MLQAVALLTLVTMVARAQDAPRAPRTSAASEAPLELLRLGTPKEKVLEAWGSPRRCYAIDFVRYFDDCSLAYEISLNVWEGYSRKTAENEYEILISYRPDQRLSRLHPTLKIAAIWFTLDHPLALESLLADSLEARELCRGGCQIDAENSTGTGGMLQIAVYPVSPTPEEAAAAAVAAGSDPTDPDCHWLPTIIATHNEWRRYNERRPQWFSDKIEEFRLKPHDPNFERRMARDFPFSDAPPVQLGKWSPLRSGPESK